MFFSYESAVREMQRNNAAGGTATISKRWFGWIVVDEPYRKVEEVIVMNTYVLLYPVPACLRVVAEQAAKNSPAVIITQAQIDQYIAHLAKSAFKVNGWTCLKVICDNLPKAYQEPAESIFIKDDAGNLTSIKNRFGARVNKEQHETAYIALHEAYPKLTLTAAKPKEE
jgi:hypothetical protein